MSAGIRGSLRPYRLGQPARINANTRLYSSRWSALLLKTATAGPPRRDHRPAPPIRRAQPHQRCYSTPSNASETDTAFLSCPGCGAAFQYDNPHLPGFLVRRLLPKSKPDPIYGRASHEATVFKKALASLPDHWREKLGFEDSSQKPVGSTTPTPLLSEPVCRRCHSLKHHNTPPSTPSDIPAKRPASGSRQQFRRSRALSILVFDIMDFPRSIPDLSTLNLHPSDPILLVATKADMLPAGANSLRLQQLIHRYITRIGSTDVAEQLDNAHSYRDAHRGLSTTFVPPVHIVSSRKNIGIRDLASRIRDLRRPGDDVHIIGQVNAGKSELVNALLRISEGKGHAGKRQYVTGSWVPGTTVGDIRIPMNAFYRSLYDASNSVGDEDGAWCIDTPGVKAAPSATDDLTVQEARWLASIRENGRLKSQTFRLKHNQSLFLGGLLRMDHAGNDFNYSVMVTVCSPLVPHITNTARADELVEQLASSSPPRYLYPPLHQGRSKPMPRLQSYLEFTAEGDQSNRISEEVVFGGGLGWIGLTGKFPPTQWKVHTAAEGYAWRRTAGDALMPWEFLGPNRSVTKSYGKISLPPGK